MIFYNLHWQWKLPSLMQPHGVVFHPIGFNKETALRRKLPDPFPQKMLFDPNFYFLNLNYDECGPACRNIATYDYVPIQVQDFNSCNFSKIKDWLERVVGPNVRNFWPPDIRNMESIKECITKCLNYQKGFGVYRLIIPTPHIYNPTDSLSSFQYWIDCGLPIAQTLEMPSLVSLSISEICVSQHSEAILDQITSREEVQGIYISIESSRVDGYAPDNPEVAKFLLDASYLIGHKRGLEVIINFADVFGLACLSAGASAFATGYESKTKRLNFERFLEERGGGGAYPRFFSLATGRTYRVIEDLNKIRDKQLLRIFENDKTSSSTSLFNALEAGEDANSVPQWRKSKNNVITAKSHVIERLREAADNMNSMSNFNEKIQWTFEWLQDAESINTYFDSRFEDDKLEAEGGNMKVWRSAFEDFLKEYKLI